MARIRNITRDTLSLFRSDAPPIDAGDEVTVRDENFVDRAWPKSTWDLVEPPELDGYVDQSSDDAWLYAELAEPDFDTALVEELGGLTVAELKDRAAAAGVETTATKKVDLIAAIAAHHSNRHNEED
ncbi:hypothetical protein [Pimelobacter simplex]|uniref:hypothetical protein n=1 Tax=Nocardioides simplex TaxID=2045 RepID=UPI0021505466|nr:hypothetical protein [Pimelobacter simplex]UUW87401.1 hypothetical protein M0M43_16800 [Pimelobacter simplex]UUW96906.1 hypothetical protein M0M48_05445 [Pimelobacter simplex]